ncbi:MAG: family 10 glycosylhydrolase [Solobacterium sp.]|nr:family 10 glycosylhydrolase [Solobacterium sp.]
MRIKAVPILLTALVLFFSGCKAKPSSQAITAAPKETADTTITEPVYGIWFSYLEYRALCTGMNEEEFSAFCDQAVVNMKDMGFNRLYLHAVAFTDAFYDSKIYPRTAVLPDIDYDPFAVFSKKAKAAGIKVEAWINPMRSVTPEEIEALPEDFIIRKWVKDNDERVRQSGDRYYLNPAYPEVRKLIVSVAEELCDRYDIDGIHMDDYFYPYDTKRNFDAYIYSLVQEENPELSLEDFRTNNVDLMVKELHDAVKKKNPKLYFDISPAGNIDNCINLLFANPYHWCENNTVDYLIPQIYWGYLHPIKPFEPTLQEWKAVAGDSGVAILPGLAAYNIGLRFKLSEDDEVNGEWETNDDLMARQTKTSLEEGCPGVVYFSYSSFFHPDEETADIVAREIEHLKDQIGK